MNFRMPNRRLHARALRTVYSQTKTAPAAYGAQLQWERGSWWNLWAVFREYDRLARAERV